MKNVISYKTRALAFAGMALAMVDAGSATAADSFARRWKNRTPSAPFYSGKSALSLEFCIATGISDFTIPSVIHGENITEIDSTIVQMGVRIKDSGNQRSVIFVANPRSNDRTAAVIKDCI